MSDEKPEPSAMDALRELSTLIGPDLEGKAYVNGEWVDQPSPPSDEKPDQYDVMTHYVGDSCPGGHHPEPSPPSPASQEQEPACANPECGICHECHGSHLTSECRDPDVLIRARDEALAEINRVGRVSGEEAKSYHVRWQEAEAQVASLREARRSDYELLKDFDNYGSDDLSVCIREVLRVVTADLPQQVASLRAELEDKQKVLLASAARHGTLIAENILAEDRAEAAEAWMAEARRLLVEGINLGMCDCLAIGGHDQERCLWIRAQAFLLLFPPTPQAAKEKARG